MIIQSIVCSSSTLRFKIELPFSIQKRVDDPWNDLHTRIVTKVRLGRFFSSTTRNVGCSILLKALQIAFAVTILVAITLALTTGVIGGTVAHTLLIRFTRTTRAVAWVRHQFLLLNQNVIGKNARTDAIVLVWSGITPTSWNWCILGKATSLVANKIVFAVTVLVAISLTTFTRFVVGTLRTSKSRIVGVVVVSVEIIHTLQFHEIRNPLASRLA
mmetsp:Transcript_20208/g.33501  ORF Transcript_20208/g.33501 Transcript_20208/m.33501 type:complete len:215 (-) Transcript_20208:146-790(-)